MLPQLLNMQLSIHYFVPSPIFSIILAWKILFLRHWEHPDRFSDTGSFTSNPYNILLLGCGDPRNVLFTAYNEASGSERHLDITCSDMDPGIIARNILLLTMIIDNPKRLGKFFLWLYVEMESLPSDRQKFLRDAFAKQSQEASEKSKGTIFSSARAAGPLMLMAISVYSEHMKHYARTGVSSTDPRVVTAATMINPTFAYSFVGEGCNVHYGTSPLTPFPSAALFGNATRALGMKDVVVSAQKQFGEWSDAFYTRVSSQPGSVALRFVLSEATALCRAFRDLNDNHRIQTVTPISQWKATMLTFDSAQYSATGSLLSCAPTIFNVIDTSNLVDHVGYLNILVSTIPLRTVDGTIYTESLLYKGEDATKELTEQLFSDLGTVSLLLGVAPIDYLSNFFTRSNTHEIMLHNFADGGQFHQVTTWKSPMSADVPVDGQPSVAFDNMQLGTFLWDMYHRMFEEEDAMTYWAKHGANLKAISKSSLISYNRESFVLFLRLARSNLGLTSSSAALLDETQVQVLPESLSPSKISTPVFSKIPQHIGPSRPVVASFNEECEVVNWLSTRIDIQNPDVIHSYGSLGAIPEIKQLSPCTARITVSGISQMVIFPVPIRGEDNRLRLARKSLWIELLVPPSGPSQNGGMPTRPFPVVLASAMCPEIHAWNVHYVNLSRLPFLDCSHPTKLYKWLNPHIGSMMSTRERKERKRHEKDDLMFVKDTLHAIMVRASGIQGGKARRLFSLMDKGTHNTDTLLFVNGLRYDQSAHTVM
ncbi:protein [Lentinula edodes]|uniref:Protein n=1 Tax=Lentinula edodes TaxID=5353 RepID=A0A1Q3EL69_LENED|nr:protein [Lentinula edodes]